MKRLVQNTVRRTAFVLMLGLASAACDSMSNDGVLAPTRSASLLSKSGVAVIVTQTLQKDSASFAIIGANGGTLKAGAHTLYVPAGAVSNPTVFAMQVLSGSNIYVQLRAVDTRTGATVSVFATPVKLTLSYQKTYFADPSVLSVIYLPNGLLGDYVPMPSTVNTNDMTVSSWLPHFSDYTLGENRTMSTNSGPGSLSSGSGSYGSGSGSSNSGPGSYSSY